VSLVREVNKSPVTEDSEKTRESSFDDENPCKKIVLAFSSAMRELAKLTAPSVETLTALELHQSVSENTGASRSQTSKDVEA